MKLKLAFIIIISSGIISASAQNKRASGNQLFTESLDQDNCTFNSTGKNLYFILEPGYQLILEGLAGKDSSRLVITVLHETKKIGNVETRVVEENETVNGKTIEISRNYFAFCQQTNTAYYFGEEVDMYKDGKIINHEGSWIAEGKNKAGVAMPGLILLGSRFYQEIAPTIAMDRAEIISNIETITTQLGVFKNCLKIEETTALHLSEKEYKLYAPGIGLINDEDLWLVKYGYVK